MKMRMSKKLKNKWIKALRSGEYGQTREILTDGKGNFCCLGVLQHVTSGGRCETYEWNNDFRRLPTPDWYAANAIELGMVNEHKTSTHLAIMNDGSDRTGSKPKSFKQIANWIEKNVEGV